MVQYDINQATSLLGLTLDELQDLVNTGKLEATDDGLITAESLDFVQKLNNWERNLNENS